MGAYVAGGDRETDLAIALQGSLVQFLRQGLRDNESLQMSREQLSSIFTPAGG
ncbi:flagellum-specific ATP synthase [compost metagenome]